MLLSNTNSILFVSSGEKKFPFVVTNKNQFMQSQNLIDKISSIKNDLLKLGENYAAFYTKVIGNIDITRDEKEYEQKIKEMREGKIPEGFPVANDPEIQGMLIDQMEERFKREIEIRRNVYKILPIDEETNEKWMQLTRELSETVDQLSETVDQLSAEIKNK